MWNTSPIGESEFQNWLADSDSSDFSNTVTEAVTEEDNDR